MVNGLGFTNHHANTSPRHVEPDGNPRADRPNADLASSASGSRISKGQPRHNDNCLHRLPRRTNPTHNSCVHGLKAAETVVSPPAQHSCRPAKGASPSPLPPPSDMPRTAMPPPTWPPDDDVSASSRACDLRQSLVLGNLRWARVMMVPGQGGRVSQVAVLAGRNQDEHVPHFAFWACRQPRRGLTVRELT